MPIIGKAVREGEGEGEVTAGGEGEAEEGQLLRVLDQHALCHAA